MIPAFNYTKAYAFYNEHIFNQNLFALLIEHNLNSTGCIPSVYWELFGSILTGSNGSIGYGSDLCGYEIKSATYSNTSYEYQYHLNSGLDKLQEDKKVDHIYCKYTADYKNVDVYFLKGNQLAPLIEEWIPKYKTNYDSQNTKQRFRKGVVHTFVKQHGSLIMQIVNCQLKYTHATSSV